MLRTSLAIGVALAIAAPSTPQESAGTSVVPAAYRTKFGDFGNGGWARGPAPGRGQKFTRYQYIYLGTELPTAQVMSGMALRQAADLAGATMGAEGPTIEIEVRIGYTTQTVATLDMDHSKNFVGTPTTVFPKAKWKIPNNQWAQLPVGVFHMQLPFKNIFRWVRQANRNLLLEVTIHSSSAQTPGCTICTRHTMDWASDRNGVNAATATHIEWTSRGPTRFVSRTSAAIVCFYSGSLPPIAQYDFYGSGCNGTAPTVGATIPPQTANQFQDSFNAVFEAGGRKQWLYPGSYLPNGPVRTLAMRFPSTYFNFNFNGAKKQYTISIGHTAKNATTMDLEFAKNIDSGALTKIFDGLLDLPKPELNKNPHDFKYKIPLNKPWIHARPAGKNLLIDAVSTDATRYFAPMTDGISDPNAGWTSSISSLTKASFKSTTVPIFRFEGIAGAEGPSFLSTDRPITGSTMDLNLVNAKPSSPAALILGASKDKFGAFTLPLQLPGNCSLLASIDLVFGVVTDATGNGSTKLGIPADAGLHGNKFYNQYLVVDSRNPLGIVFTQAAEGTFGAQ